MLNDLLRTFGAASIIAGIALFFTMGISEDPKVIAENAELKTEVDSLQSLLKRTEEELANVQTVLTNAEKSTVETEEEQIETNEDGIVKTILVIESGTTSKNVAKRLEQTAIIEDAALLNTYLTSHKLSGKIQIGEYTLDSSMSIEAIAERITTSN